MGSAWLPSLQELSERCQSFVVWKHLEAALVGSGDVDACVHPDDLELATLLFARFAFRQWRARAVILCDHLSAVRIALALTSEEGPTVAELDLMHGTISKLGVTWASTGTFVELSSLNQHAVRELRPGAQAVVEIMTRGLETKRHLSPSEIAKLHAMVSEDRAGADLAVQQMLPRNAHRVVMSILDDIALSDWHNHRLLHLRSELLSYALLHPKRTIKRLRTRRHESASCLVRSVGTSRVKHPPSTVDVLLRSADREGHIVLTPSLVTDAPNKDHLKVIKKN